MIFRHLTELLYNIVMLTVKNKLRRKDFDYKRKQKN